MPISSHLIAFSFKDVPHSCRKCCIDREDDKQFRRIIRYLKRWKDVKFSSDGNAAPIGIGITVAAYHWFNPVYTRDSFTNIKNYDDLEGLRCFVNVMLAKFQNVYFNSNIVQRLIVELPVSPHNDLFEKMADNQMADFQEKLEILLEAIGEAQQKADPVEACKILQKQFGDDFPIPNREDTAQKRLPASQGICSKSRMPSMMR